MKITIYKLLEMIKDGKAPKKIKYNDKIWRLASDGAYFIGSDYGFDFWVEHGDDKFEDEPITLNDEVEIIEEENKFTKEDFIKEALDLENLTREEFNKIYEVKECNCGKTFCKDFIKVEKVGEEKKIPEKLSTWFSLETSHSKELNREYANTNFENMYEKINEIIDCLDYLKNKGE